MARTEPPELRLTWRAVALAAVDTIAALWIARAVTWVGACAWGWLTS